MSGVSRLRAAKKGGGSLSITHVSQKTAANGGASVRPDPGFTGPPKKKGAWTTYPQTPPPEGSESPSRGEADSD